MQQSASTKPSALPCGLFIAPIHPVDTNTPLRIAVLGKWETDPNEDPFVLLHELPGARVYLGAVCDTATQILFFLELHLQTPGNLHSTLAAQNHPFTNLDLDRRWLMDLEPATPSDDAGSIILGMERVNPAPVLVKHTLEKPPPLLAETAVSPLRLCQDDALLERAGLSAYATSLTRYLHRPGDTNSPFWATSSDAPKLPIVEPFGAIAQAPDVLAIFNPHAGLIRARKLAPLSLEDYLNILEGGSWGGFWTGTRELFVGPQYERLRMWSGNRQEGTCLLHSTGCLADRLSEILFLKLGLLLELMTSIREYARSHQSPLLNLSPASFQVSLAELGGHFPLLWSAKAHLIKSGQAYPLEVAGATTPYFVRLGSVEPSPFMPEGVNAHSFGVGSVFLRQLLEESEGIVIEGTLRTNEYVTVTPDDLLWLQLPIAAADRTECYARAFANETRNPREIRFRSLPQSLPPSVVGALRRLAGAALPRAPYEVWPVLSTPCDLFSLAVIGARILLASQQDNLPVLLDDILSFRRSLFTGSESAHAANLADRFHRDAEFAALLGPHRLIAEAIPPVQALEALPTQLWSDVIYWLVRLFPGVQNHGYCRNMSDVSALAPETVFDAPLRDLRMLVLRARSLVLPGISTHTEIVQVLREAMPEQ